MDEIENCLSSFVPLGAETSEKKKKKKKKSKIETREKGGVGEEKKPQIAHQAGLPESSR